MTTPQSRGRRNRMRGIELQREAVSMAIEHGLEAFNRDRGGAQHEGGDIEIQGKFYGCKRRKSLPSYLVPEKQEVGVIIRGERDVARIVIPLTDWLELIAHD